MLTALPEAHAAGHGLPLTLSACVQDLFLVTGTVLVGKPL